MALEPAPECSLSCQRPLTHGCSHTILAPPLTRSLRGNNIGVEGASALAAILKETMISNLECAATPSVFAFVSAPIDTSRLHTHLRPHPRSLKANQLGPDGGAAIAEGLKGNSTMQSLK